jgi:hypothetical protein
MIEIIENLYIGDDSDCINQNRDMTIIHACKTCHQKGVGYRGNLPSTHPNYLILETNGNLYLNLVDMERELFAKSIYLKNRSLFIAIRGLHVRLQLVLSIWQEKIKFQIQAI